MNEETTAGRQEECCYISHRNGAYLIAMGLTHQTDAAPAHELYDCASALPKAKRVAVEMARSFGYGGAVRWRDEGALLILTMTATSSNHY